MMVVDVVLVLLVLVLLYVVYKQRLTIVRLRRAERMQGAMRNGFFVMGKFFSTQWFNDELTTIDKAVGSSFIPIKQLSKRALEIQRALDKQFEELPESVQDALFYEFAGPKDIDDNADAYEAQQNQQQQQQQHS
jgi:hypothetical protein